MTLLSGALRTLPEDFQVTEILGFAPSGSGEHLWVRLRKTGWNTQDVALVLAKSARLPLRSVGFSGLKDRQAITEQWFSLHLPGKPDPALENLPSGIEILERVRHGRKLNRGTHRANRFEIRVRELAGDDSALESTLLRIQVEGVPNFFGEQRFGIDDNNVKRGLAWLSGEGEAPRKTQTRSFWLSAVRSYLFNLVLQQRVQDATWNRVISGDILQPDGKRGLFYADEDEQSAARVAAGEVHPTAPLPGKSPMALSGEAAVLEQRILQPYQGVIAGLEREAVDAMRRATRLPVQDFSWQRQQDQLVLNMTLPSGAFATAVLGNFLQWRFAPLPNEE